MDLDTFEIENLGNPVGTGFNYMFSDLWRINDAGERAGYGSLKGGELTRVRLASAAQSTPAFLAVSTASNPIPILGGVFYPDLTSGGAVALATDSLGRFGFTFAWPTVAQGTPYYMQAGALDSSAPQGLSLSNAMVGVTQ